MPKTESPLQALEEYLPPGTFPMVLEYIIRHKVHLTITRSRATVLGDYRHATHASNHRISVNGNLNAYAFLITLLHELAHLLTFLQHGNRVSAHGREWKSQFSGLLRVFTDAKVFPEDIRLALSRSLENPAASSCADDQLIRVLRNYDAQVPDICLVEEIKPGGLFAIRGGRVFRRGEVRRKRILCVETATGKSYLFSPVHEVRKIL